jgi:hypothetical protein
MPRQGLWVACAVAVCSGVSGCTPPPILAPQRMADRGLTPLARTAEVRLSPTVYLEQRRLSDEHASDLTIEVNDIAVRPNFFAAFAFTDSLALLLPLGVLWSPAVQVDRGLWLTMGGGVYGFAFNSGGDVQLNDAIGVWAKRRFGSDLWLMGGVAAWHTYDSTASEDSDATDEHWLWLIPGVEAGVQVTKAWAVALLADYRHGLLDGEPRYSRLRLEHILVPVWWIDLGVHGGVYLHAREDLHLDPLVGFTVTGRW